jgi:hypothetical protein
LILHSAVKDENEIETELEEVRKQAKELRRKSNFLQLRLGEKMPATTSAILEYAKLDCQMLCDKIYETFPREVRDIIYVHIHTKQQGSINVVYMVDQGAWDDPKHPAFNQSKSEAHWRTGRPGDYENHLWSTNFLGNRVLEELLEWYYRATTFQFGKNWAFIPEFRSTDQWKLGHVPADFVTNVEVTLNCNDYEVIEMYGANDDDPPRGEWGDGSGWITSCRYGCVNGVEQKDSRSKLLTSLESLFGFKQGTKIIIEVMMSSAYDSDMRAHMRDIAVPFILPTLLRLQASGYNVTIQLSPWDNFKFSLATTVHDVASFEQEYARLSHIYLFSYLPGRTDNSSSKPSKPLR